MPSLTQLLTSHRRLLVLDATSANTQVGLLAADAESRWQSAPEEAGTALFTHTESLLGQADWRLADIGAFVFCAGPGSMLGTRTVAMALRTWLILGRRPVYSFCSLAVAARHEWGRQPGRSFTVIADARRDTWHGLPVAVDGSQGALERLPAANLPAGELVTPEHFRAWAPLPRPATVCSYDLARIFPALGNGDFFVADEAPDAFQHEAPDYKKWSAQIHSSTTAPGKT